MTEAEFDLIEERVAALSGRPLDVSIAWASGWGWTQYADDLDSRALYVPPTHPLCTNANKEPDPFHTTDEAFRYLGVPRFHANDAAIWREIDAHAPPKAAIQLERWPKREPGWTAHIIRRSVHIQMQGVTRALALSRAWLLHLLAE